MFIILFQKLNLDSNSDEDKMEVEPEFFNKNKYNPYYYNLKDNKGIIKILTIISICTIILITFTKFYSKRKWSLRYDITRFVLSLLGRSFL